MPNAPELLPQWQADHAPPPGPQTYVQPFCIGPVRIERPFVLAPMSGVTDSPFRRLVQSASGGAVGLLVTEFISIEGLTRNNLRTALRMAYVAAEEFPLSVQIFGGEIPRMVEAAKMAADHGAQIVDINCGCPAPKVVRRGGGAELLRRGPHLAKMVEETAKAVAIPVTVKIRSGWDQDSLNATEIASACVQAGAQSVAVHGRTRVQLYSGHADWGVVDQVAKTVSVPVVGSGDVTTPEEALWRLRTTAAAGVMIGRAAIMNPWIFGQIDDLVQGKPKREISSQDRLRVLYHYKDMESERMPDHAMPGRIKQLLARMTKGFQYGSLLREKAMRAHTTNEMFEHIERFFAAVDAGTVEQWAADLRGTVAPDAFAPQGSHPSTAADQLA